MWLRGVQPFRLAAYRLNARNVLVSSPCEENILNRRRFGAPRDPRRQLCPDGEDHRPRDDGLAEVAGGCERDAQAGCSGAGRGYGLLVRRCPSTPQLNQQGSAKREGRTARLCSKHAGVTTLYRLEVGVERSFRRLAERALKSARDADSASRIEQPPERCLDDPLAAGGGWHGRGELAAERRRRRPKPRRRVDGAGEVLGLGRQALRHRRRLYRGGPRIPSARVLAACSRACGSTRPCADQKRVKALAWS